MFAYSVGIAKVEDFKAWEEYAKRSRILTRKRGGKIIVRRGRQIAVEGCPLDGKIGVVRWPSFEDAVTHYRSPEHAAVKACREGAGTLQRYIVEVDERLDSEAEMES